MWSCYISGIFHFIFTQFIGFWPLHTKTKAGILSVAIDTENVVMEQTLPVSRQAPKIDAVAAALGVNCEVISETGLPIEIFSTGLSDILIPVQFGQLDTLKPNFDAIADLSREFNTIGFHVLSLAKIKKLQLIAVTLHLYMASMKNLLQEF